MMAIFSGEKREGDSPRRRASDLMPLSIVAHDLTITGDLQADGVVKIEGVVRGTIKAANQILVAPGARIDGDLYTREAVVGGTVCGTIHAGERVELQATAVVEGDIHAPRIGMSEGARISGEVKMDADGVTADGNNVTQA
jgi:cytoskeletal protein CcmA (bactofilin family)